jgi:hypothetical protein
LIRKIFAHFAHTHKLFPVVLAGEIGRLELHDVTLIRLPESAPGIPDAHNRDAAATWALVDDDECLTIEAAVKAFVGAFEFVQKRSVWLIVHLFAFFLFLKQFLQRVSHYIYNAMIRQVKKYILGKGCLISGIPIDQKRNYCS